VNLTPAQLRRLLNAARVAQRKAYAPYSKFPVGAALLTKSGKLFTGCNVENASYGLTICAERVAIGKAVSEGHRQFCAIAVVAPSKEPTPCGACRQVLAEFGDCLVVCADSRQSAPAQIYRLAELLPATFRFSARPVASQTR
jgi:cytidine deaminase